jgi:PadR family transcriptional regulator, regulatory protein PadR
MTDLRWLSQVKRGLLELCILNLLNRETMYGYQLVKRLTSVPGLVTGAGTVYPLLSRLKRDGLLTSTLVESPAGPARRTYVLTATGRRHMRSINEAWREVAVAVSEFVTEENAQRP